MEKKLPDPRYLCTICYTDHCWPPSDLFWSEVLSDWCCELCWSEVDEHWAGDRLAPQGVTLAEELKNREKSESTEKPVEPRGRGAVQIEFNFLKA